MELHEFLLARIAEDEKVARLAPERMVERLEQQGEAIARSYGDPQPPEDDVSLADAMWWTAKDAADWIRRHNPTRVLAECEAKRRIVEQYAEYLSTVRAYRSPRWADAMNEQDKQDARQAEARHRVAEDVARLLALPYADHPQYDEAWRP